MGFETSAFIEIHNLIFFNPRNLHRYKNTLYYPWNYTYVGFLRLVRNNNKGEEIVNFKLPRSTILS